MEIDWAKTIRQYQQPLYWHIRRMVIRHDDASDLLQETFVQAFRSSHQLKDPQALRPWLYRIATNKTLRYLEQLKPELSLEEISPILAEQLHESEYIDLEDLAGIRLQEALLKLSPQQKLVFNLRYYDDLSYDEISQITGFKSSVLKASYHNAKEKIKAYLLQNR